MRLSYALVIVAVLLSFAAGMSAKASASFFGDWGFCKPFVRSICLDGTWWQHLPASAKPLVAEGMISSYIAGYRLGRFNTYSDWLTAYGAGRQTQASTRFLASLRSPGGGDPIFDKSVSAYAAAIDRFYRLYPSKRALEVAGVLRCLASHSRASCDEVGRADLLPWATGP